MFKSYRTTIAGLAAVLTAVASALTALTDADPATVPQWEAVVSAVVAGLGLMFARDNGVSSEKAGAR